MTLGFIEDPAGRRVELSWKDISRLTTAIGSETLTIRGSDKAIYGKLFEKLILGSFLSILGFQRINPPTNRKTARPTSLTGPETKRVFWLSDRSGVRECDATLLFQPGKLARFDIGFIGPGNSEISKDKLSRYERELELGGSTHYSGTYIVVDRLPETSKTKETAIKIGADIIQMSMQYWPRDLAQRLGRRFTFEHELQTMPDPEIGSYLTERLATMPIQDFLTGVFIAELEAEAEPRTTAGAVEEAEEDDE